jgi:plasmid maintenance system antidote protein VapI
MPQLVIDPEMAPREFADALATAGMTQVEMAAFLGVADRTVRRYLTGDAVIPASTAILLRVMRQCDLRICVSAA